MTLGDLTVPFGNIDREGLLADWRWLIGPTKQPILLAASGDAFLQDELTGEIFVLDVNSGTMEKVSSSEAHFRVLLSDAGFVTSYLAPQMVHDLTMSGLSLGEGQVYSFIKPPVLGGEYSVENVQATDIEVHFSIMGQIQEQVQPAGQRENPDSVERTPPSRSLLQRLGLRK